MSWIRKILIGLDQLGNSLARGNPDETISSRVGRNAAQGQRFAIMLEGLIDCFFAFWCGQRHHCFNNIEPPRGREKE